MCIGCSDSFAAELILRARRDLPQIVERRSDAELSRRVSAGIHRALLRGAISPGAVSRFVILMLALEPEFDERSRVREYLDTRSESFDAALLGLEKFSHPNCWYEADASFVEDRWRAMSSHMQPHPCTTLAPNDVSEIEPALPRQLSADYGFQLDVPYVETPDAVVRSMLELAQVSSSDTVIDLGSGDGRVVIMAAASFGARGIGFDLNPENITVARQAAARAGISERVTFKRRDLFDVDVSEATVVTLYLLRHINLRLRERLRRQLLPGTRVVSRHFDMGDWQPDIQLGKPPETIYCWHIR
jgi:SAM-dependent methyltransferase